MFILSEDIIRRQFCLLSRIDSNTVDKIPRGTTPWWPLIPGAVLLFMGVETGRMNMGTLISKGWPVVLIVVGLLYLTGKIGSSRPGDSDGGRDGPAGP